LWATRTALASHEGPDYPAFNIFTQNRLTTEECIGLKDALKAQWLSLEEYGVELDLAHGPSQIRAETSVYTNALIIPEPLGPWI
jgi:hypothetical protein